MKMKIIAIILIVLLVGGAIGYFLAPKIQETVENLGDAYNPVSQGLTGSASHLITLPNSYVFADSTTTDSGIDGGLVNQLIDTDGVNQVRFNVMAKGGTATSTLSARVMYSYDKTNYFDSATSTKDNVGTTTMTLLPSVYAFDPGTATTSYSFLFDIAGAKYTRIILMGEDISTDPNDGVRAWIDAINLVFSK